MEGRLDPAAKLKVRAFHGCRPGWKPGPYVVWTPAWRRPQR